MAAPAAYKAVISIQLLKIRGGTILITAPETCTIV
jgi:hypothetical protein